MRFGNVTFEQMDQYALAALRKVGPAARAIQARDYIAALRNYPGIDGVYDFVTSPQRGSNEREATIVRWDQSSHAWVGATPAKL